MTSGQKTTLALVMLFAFAAFARNKLQKIETHSGASPGVVTIKGDDFQVATGGSNGECLIWDTSADAGVSWGSCGGALGDGDYGDILVDGGVWDLQANTVGDGELNAGSATDEYCLTYETDGGVLEWQTCGAGGGDSVTVNSGATTDPNFLDGDIDWTYAGTDITATVGCSQCVSYSEVQNVSTTNRLLGRDTAGAGVIEEITMEAALDMVTTWTTAVLYHNSGGAWGPTNWTTDGTNITPFGDASGNLGSGVLRWAALYAADVISPDGVDVTDLDFVSDPGAGEDEYCVTYEHSTGNFQAQSCGGVSDGDKGDITVSGSGTSWQIDASTVGASEITDYSITATELAAGSVTSFAIGTNEVGPDEIIASGVGSSEIATDAVGADEIATGGVGTAEVADDSLLPDDLQDLNVKQDGDVLSYESTGTQFFWISPSELVCETAWPVDSIYISMSSTNPGTSLGCGTWSAFATGRMLIGVDGGKSWSSAGATGGNTDMQHEHTLDEVVSHTHTIPAYNHATGSSANKVEVTSSATASSATTGSTGTGATVNTNTEVTPGTSTGTDPVPWIAVYMWRRTA